MITGVAIVCAVALVMWWIPPPGERRVQRLGDRADGRRGTSDGEGRVAAWSLHRLRRRSRRWWQRRGIGPGSRRRRARRRAEVLQALGALAAELEAGSGPSEALLRAQGEPSVWPQAAAAARWGADIAEALERDAEGSPVLGQVAACWRVGSRGAGLVDALQHVASSARNAEDVRVEMEAQLAGPRSTARMLAVLPLVGLGLGTMLGADPWTWLIGSMPGRICLALGIGLTGLGTWWTGRIAAGVERRL